MILVIGDIMLDRYFWGEVTRISPEAPVPIVKVTDITYSLGGAANVAANLIGMGEEVVTIGVVGRDKSADILIKLMREQGITDYTIVENNRPTTVKTRVIASTQQLLRIDHEETKFLYKRSLNKMDNYIRKVLPKCKAIIISDYGKGVVSYDLLDFLMISEKVDIPIFVDPKGIDWSLYDSVFCVTPNLKEFLTYYYSAYPYRNIANEQELRRAAQETADELSLNYLVVTRGADGMLVVPNSDNKSLVYQASVEHVEEVRDVSGAGDTVIAALACKIANGADMFEAANFANKMASIVVSRLGTSPIKKEEV